MTVADNSGTHRDTLPPGLLLPSGFYLAHEAHRSCECAGCHEAFRAHDAGELDLDGDDEEALPW